MNDYTLSAPPARVTGAHAELFGAARLTSLQSCSAYAIQELGELNSGCFRSLWQEAGRRHAWQRVCLQAPEKPSLISPEVDAAVCAEFQHGMGTQGVFPHQNGCRFADNSWKYFARAADLVLGLIVEHFARQ